MPKDAVRFSALLLTIFSMFCSAVASGESTRVLSAELPLASLKRVCVENLVGTMRVSAVTGETDRIRAVMTVHASDSTLSNLIRVEQVRGDKGIPTLRVIYPLKKFHSLRSAPDASPPLKDKEQKKRGMMERLGLKGGSSVSYGDETADVSDDGKVLLYVDVKVEVPNASGVQIIFRNLVGRIEAEGLNGRYRFSSASAGISLVKVGKQVEVDTRSGDLVSMDALGELTCRTGSGNCKIEGFQGEKLDLDTGSGNVSLRNASAGILSAETSSGDVLIDSSSVRTASVKSGSGIVSIRSSKARAMSAETSSGEIAAVQAEADTIRAESQSGNVLIDSPGSRLVQLSVDTGSGNVTLALSSDASFQLLAEHAGGRIGSGFYDALPIYKEDNVVGYWRKDGLTKIAVDTGTGDVTVTPAR